MGELDKTELAALEGRKVELERARTTGFAERFPFLGAHEANVENQILALRGTDALGLSEEDRKKQTAEQQGIAMAKASYDVQISHYAANGFGSKQDLYSFANNFGNDDFYELFNSKSEKEQDKILQNFVDGIKKNMSPEEQQNFIENIDPRLKKELQERGLLEQFTHNPSLEKLTQGIEQLGGEQALKSVNKLQEDIASYDRDARRDEQNQGYVQSNADARDRRDLSIINTRNIVLNAAEDKKLPTHGDTLEQAKDSFQLVGVDEEKMKEASKAIQEITDKGGELQDNRKNEAEKPLLAKADTSKDMDLSFLS